MKKQLPQRVISINGRTYLPSQFPPFTVQRESGISLLLTPQIRVTLRMVDSEGRERVGTGSWTIVDANSGQLAYQWSEDDMALTGVFMCHIAIISHHRPIYTLPTFACVIEDMPQ